MAEETSDVITIKEVKEILDAYEGWHVFSPEDSWRLERDLREVLGMPQAELPEW